MPARTKEEQPLAEDTNMEDAPASAQPETNDEDAEEDEDEEEEEEIEPQRVRIVSYRPRREQLLVMDLLTCYSAARFNRHCCLIRVHR